MKELWVSLLIILGLTSSTKSASNEKGEECSVKISNIKFNRSLNKAKDLATVVDGKLVLKCNAKCDNFFDPDGKLSNNTAPVLLSKVNNNKPFTFTAKVIPTFIDTYDAGAMYVYLSEKLWVKFAFERDERMRTRIVSVRTIETSDDNNHDTVDNKSVYMKISSDTKTIGYYYSLDNKNWQLVRLYRNEYPNEIWLGLSAQSPLGNGTTVTFEECSFTENCIIDFRMGM
jgi:hypothetical protein